MTKTTKLTLKDIIAKKEQIKRSKATPKVETIKIASLDGLITLQQPSIDVIKDSQEFSDTDDGNKYLVYNCCVEPNLKDPELQREFGVELGMDIVSELFDYGEIGVLATRCLELVGFGNESVKTIKN